MEIEDLSKRSYFWFSVSMGLFLGLILGFGVSAALSALQYRNTHGVLANVSLAPLPSQAKRGGRLGKMPELVGFVNQNGKPISSDMFLGKVQIVSFISPYGVRTSPILVSNLMNLYQELKQSKLLGNRVVFVSYNLNSGTAGPAVMRKFMQKVAGLNGVDAGNWEFLTAPQKALSQVVAMDFRVYYHVLNDADYRAWATQHKAGGNFNYAIAANPLALSGPKGKHVVDHDVLLIIGPNGKVRVRIHQASAFPITRILRYVAEIMHLPGMTKPASG